MTSLRIVPEITIKINLSTQTQIHTQERETHIIRQEVKENKLNGSLNNCTFVSTDKYIFDVGMNMKIPKN